MKCACSHDFTTDASTYRGTQLFTDTDTGAVWLYLVLFACPACHSTRARVMYEDVADDESERAEAAE